MRAVLDRIEDGVAVLLVGDDESPLEVAADALPRDAGAGDVLVIDADGRPVAIDHEATDAARAAAEVQLTRIRSRQHGGRFAPPPGGGETR